jgi:hypothetical protein
MPPLEHEPGLDQGDASDPRTISVKGAERIPVVSYMISTRPA